MFGLGKGPIYLTVILGFVNGYFWWKPLFEGKHLKKDLPKQELDNTSVSQNVIYFKFIKNNILLI